jgi:hypothetical protein
MMKLLAYVAAPISTGRREFLEMYQRGFLPDLLGSAPEIRHCTASLVDDDLTSLAMNKLEFWDGAAGLSYDGAIELWLDAPAARIGAIIQQLVGSPGRIDAYWVQEYIAKDTAPVSELPALRLVSPCQSVAHKSPPEVFRHWREHAQMAERVHIGMSRYIQNWHLAPITQDAPSFFGTPTLSFQTLADWTERLYANCDAAREIAADVAKFVKDFIPLFTLEHRLR